MKALNLFVGFAIASLFLTSCGQDSKTDHSATTIAQRTPITVKTQIADASSSQNPVVLSGKIQAKDQATVSARMMGYITALNIEVGDRVSAGQTILTIRNNELPAKRSQIDASVTEAKAALQNVKVNFDRMKALWEQESITRKEWDDISAQYNIMKAKVDAANAMRTEIDEAIAYTKVSAPISGVVTAKMINRGDLVNPGVPLMSIQGNRGYEVATNVSDDYISQIKKGMAVEVEIKSLGKRVNAVISEISPSAVNTGGQFGIKAELKLNADELKAVFPGMYASVIAKLTNIASPRSSSNLIIDKSALFTRGQLTGIYTISNQNTALLRWIRTGKDYGNAIEIVSGLANGEEYIVDNIDLLSDGLPVRK